MIIQKVLIFCFIILLTIFSCSSEDENSAGPDDGHPPTEMIDTWIYQSVTVDGVPSNLGVVMEWDPNAVEARFHIINDIGSYSYEEVNAVGGQLYGESGFVYVEGNEIDINKLQDGQGNPIDETNYMTYTLVIDTLTLQENDAGSIFIYTLLRD